MPTLIISIYDGNWKLNMKYFYLKNFHLRMNFNFKPIQKMTMTEEQKIQAKIVREAKKLLSTQPITSAQLSQPHSKRIKLLSSDQDD